MFPDPAAPAETVNPAVATTSAPPMVPPTTPPSVHVSLPGFRSGLARSLDLCLRATPQLRPASIYIGLQFLGLLAPVVLLFAAILVREPEIAGIFDVTTETPPEISDRATGWFAVLSLAFLIAVPGLIALSLECQIIATLLLGGQLLGRPLTLRQAVAYGRSRFWPAFRASLLVGAPMAILNTILVVILEPVLGASSEGPALVASAVATFIMLPFVYATCAAVLGEVGAVEAAKRSIILQRARWQLAVLIASFGAAVSYIQLFAIGSGGDLLMRVGVTLGLGFDRGVVSAIATGAVIVAAVVALGSLTFTVAALASAPQVVAFLALTNYTGAIDRAHGWLHQVPAAAPALPWAPPPAPPLRFRWVSRPMIAGMAIGVLLAVVGLIDLAAP
jgi:hypothetical protein